jgi:hypothetical protein
MRGLDPRIQSDERWIASELGLARVLKYEKPSPAMRKS